MNLTKIRTNNTKQRVEYLLAKYSFKANLNKQSTNNLPESEFNQYIDDDPNFLPFYGLA